MKRGTPEHPKVTRLMQSLELERWGAVGILESLWHFAQKYARRGDVGRYGDAEIAEAIGWRGDAEKLVEALTAAGWLEPGEDCRLVIHDWAEHCDQTVRRGADVLADGFAEPAKPHASNGLASARKMLPAGGARADLPEPEPEPSQSRSQSLSRAAARGELSPGVTCYPRDALRQIRAEYPSRRRGGTNADYAAIDAVLCQLADRGEASPAEWLLAKARAYAASWAAKRGEYTPKLKRWCDDGVWDQEPDEWQKPDGADGFDRSQYED